MNTRVSIPEAFRASTVAREGARGAAWIDALPDRIDALCRRWDLVPEGATLHGYVAVVVPVRRGDEPLILKVSWVDRWTQHEALALRAWDGRGAVKLLDADAEAGALLLERLDPGHSLEREPIDEAVGIAAGLLRRLSVPAPPGLRSVETEIGELRATLSRRWAALGRPFHPELLEAARDVPRPRGPQRIVNQDLHYENVLRGRRAPWLVIDPKPLAGDPEFGVAPLLWNRFDPEAGPSPVRRRLEAVVREAELDPERARRWSLLRIVDYWLWALEEGFTEDPDRCRVLAEALARNQGGAVT